MRLHISQAKTYREALTRQKPTDRLVRALIDALYESHGALVEYGVPKRKWRKIEAAIHFLYKEGYGGEDET